MRASKLFILMISMVILVGCESKQPTQTPAKSPAPIDILDLTEASGPTLIVHYHDGVFDFIDHEGLVVLTSKDLDDFKVAIESQLIQDLIVDERAIFRFKGDTPPGGILPPKAVEPAIEALNDAGATTQEFDYTNKELEFLRKK